MYIHCKFIRYSVKTLRVVVFRPSNRKCWVGYLGHCFLVGFDGLHPFKIIYIRSFRAFDILEHSTFQSIRPSRSQRVSYQRQALLSVDKFCWPSSRLILQYIALKAISLCELFTNITVKSSSYLMKNIVLILKFVFPATFYVISPNFRSHIFVIIYRIKLLHIRTNKVMY